ncbi:MAG: hypothetical protein K2Q09_04810, partial [Phycisphaerales bacterium]|nr:hypothetical protein [Phycisphaerales bacterium]
PSVVVERPVLVAAPVVGGVAPGSRDVQGFESGGTVIRLARGESTIAGFTTSLDSERDGRRDGVAHGRPNDARVCMSREERTVTAHRLKRVPVVC